MTPGSGCRGHPSTPPTSHEFHIVLGVKTQDAHTHRYRVPVILKKRMPLYSTKSRVKIPLAPVKENSSHPEGAGETGLCGSFSQGRRWRV